MHRRPRLTLALLVTGFIVAALALLYTAAAWSFRAEPRPTRDLLTELNAPWAHIPHHERAAPIYQTLFDAWQALPPPQMGDQYLQLTTLTPTDPAFPDFVQALRAIAPELSAAREAATRPVLGADFAPPDLDEPATQFSPSDEIIAQSAYYLRVPALGAATTAARLLLIDADAAILEHDPDRAAANLHAALAISRQLREIPLFFADYIALNIVNAATDRIRRTLTNHPNLWTAQTLTALQADLADTATQTNIRFELEIPYFADLLDRTFTPGPSGRITAVGLRRIETLASPPTIRARIPNEHARAAPLQALTIGTRAEHLDAYETYMNAASKAQADGFRGLSNFETLETELIFNNTPRQRRLPVVHMLTPAYGSALFRLHTTQLEAAATTLALALHRYHAHHAIFPDTLDQLVPVYLTAIPTDPFDLAGGQLKYLRDPSTNTFTLYSNGSNFKDDRATPMPPDPQQQLGAINRFNTDSNGAPYPAPHNADWILHPPKN